MLNSMEYMQDDSMNSLDSRPAFLAQPSDIGATPTMYDPGNTLTPPPSSTTRDPFLPSVQGSGSGSSLLGWLNLGNQVSQTVISATRSGGSTRPQIRIGTSPAATTLQKQSGIVLAVIVAIFVGVILILRG